MTMSETTRSRGELVRHALRILAVVLVLFTPVWAAGRLLIAMNADAPVREALALKFSLGRARQARATEFAFTDLKIAEAAVEQALSEHYRTVSEKTGFLRYALVRKHLQGAQEKVNWAWLRAKERGETARADAGKLIEEGLSKVATAESALARAPIGSAVRAPLARARTSLASATMRLKAGDFDAAAREASAARGLADDALVRIRSFTETFQTGESARKWARWVRETIAISRATGDVAVVVDKLNHKCYLYRGGVLQQVYSADLGGPIHDKLKAGDRATPEGMYRVIQKRGPGQTKYYKALLINYPDDEDRAAFALAKRKGWVSKYARIGGLIEIHGEGGRREDWTLGCVALANRDMDQIFRIVSVGTPVTIVGTITG
jgi:lipoprotein-anchoring transpeptidase ErfK/SrfK